MKLKKAIKVLDKHRAKTKSKELGEAIELSITFMELLEKKLTEGNELENIM